MAKFKPGIPDSFTLNVEPVTDLGDYLDEPSPTLQRRARPQPSQEEEVRGGESVQPVESPRLEQPPVMATTPRADVVEPTPVVPTPTPQAERVEYRSVPQPFAPEPPRTPTAVNEDSLPRAKAPRREISMTPETLRMSDELLDLIRSGSGQRDTKANELFHALVLLVHEAMDEIDPHSIPKRGRWGTPTARAYPFELKNAFIRALLRKYGEEGSKYSVNDAA